MKKMMIAVGVMTLGATLAFAGPHEGGRHGRHGRHDMSARLAEKLSLTDAQKQQVAEIRKSSRLENAVFFESFRQSMDEMRAARKASDTAKVDSLKAAFQSQREQMKQIRQAEMEKFVAVLTPEQRTQFEAMKAERQARRQDHQQRQ